jgi:hypothetical protein
VSPSSERACVTVLVAGSLCGGGSAVAQVLFVGVEARIVSATCSSVTVVVGDDGANVTGDVLVIASSGAEARGVNMWKYVAEDSVTNLLPYAGPVPLDIVSSC